MSFTIHISKRGRRRMALRSEISFSVKCDDGIAGNDCWLYYQPEICSTPEVVISQALGKGWVNRDGLWLCPNCIKERAMLEEEVISGSPTDSL